jgi:hypothetical protein
MGTAPRDEAGEGVELESASAAIPSAETVAVGDKAAVARRLPLKSRLSPTLPTLLAIEERLRMAGRDGAIMPPDGTCALALPIAEEAGAPTATAEFEAADADADAFADDADAAARAAARAALACSAEATRRES